MNTEKKVTNELCAEQLGVGRPTITAVRKMLGIPSSVRKVFPSAIGRFLQTYQDFQIADAASDKAMKKFKVRHPKFVVPNSQDADEPVA